MIRAVCSGAFRLESWAEGRRHAALHADAVLWALAGARTAARRRRKALCRHLAAPGKVAVAKKRVETVFVARMHSAHAHRLRQHRLVRKHMYRYLLAT